MNIIKTEIYELYGYDTVFHKNCVIKMFFKMSLSNNYQARN